MSTPPPLEMGQQALADILMRQQSALERNRARAASALGREGATAESSAQLTLRVALDEDLVAAFNCGLRLEALLIQILRLLQARHREAPSSGA